MKTITREPNLIAIKRDKATTPIIRRERLSSCGPERVVMKYYWRPQTYDEIKNRKP